MFFCSKGFCRFFFVIGFLFSFKRSMFIFLSKGVFFSKGFFQRGLLFSQGFVVSKKFAFFSWVSLFFQWFFVSKVSFSSNGSRKIKGSKGFFFSEKKSFQKFFQWFVFSKFFF